MKRLLAALALLGVAGAAAFVALGGENGLRKAMFAQALPVTYFDPFNATPA